jgi:hypothetical protein
VKRSFRRYVFRLSICVWFGEFIFQKSGSVVLDAESVLISV